MSTRAERLRQVDQQLGALGVSDARAEAARAHARQLVRALGGIEEALATLGLATEVPSGMIEISEEVLKRSDLPPVLALEGATAPAEEEVGETTDVHSAKEIEAALAAADAAHSAGLSVDELFADAEPTSAPADSGDESLASLFADEHPLEAEGGVGSLADELGEPETSAPPAPAAPAQPAPAGPPPPPPAKPKPEMFEPPSSEFELLVDEDLLVLDSEDEP